MKLLLTTAGIKNARIHDALVDLLGKPIAECNALCIPTAGNGHPHGGPLRAWTFISGRQPECPMTDLGWKSVGDNPGLPSNAMVAAEQWAARLGGPAYAIDDQTAIKVVDGAVEVVSDGRWRYFAG